MNITGQLTALWTKGKRLSEAVEALNKSCNAHALADLIHAQEEWYIAYVAAVRAIRGYLREGETAVAHALAHQPDLERALAVEALKGSGGGD